MVALVDYRGYRLVAMTLLPLDAESQVFGSSDAGKTVHNDPDVHHLLDQLGSKLNLRDHPVGKTAEIRLKTPIDLEVHRGTVSELVLFQYTCF